MAGESPETSQKISTDELRGVLDAHLKWLTSEGTLGTRAQLRYRDLRDCGDMLKEADLRRGDLTRANLAGLSLSGAKFAGATLSSADLSNTQATLADFSECIMTRTKLCDVKYDRVDFRGANLQAADLREAQLPRCNLAKTELSWADLQGTILTNACLNQADMSARPLRLYEATFRQIRTQFGLLAPPFALDACECFGTRFPCYADDHWSILRRNYTGSRYAVLLLLTFAAFLPLVVQALFWKTIYHIEQRLHVTSLIDSISHRKDLEGSNPLPRLEERSITGLLLGVRYGWCAVALNCVLLLYHVFRAGLTFFVGHLRDEEERTNASPRRVIYERWWKVHLIATWIMPVAYCSLLIRVWSVLSTSVVVPV